MFIKTTPVGFIGAYGKLAAKSPISGQVRHYPFTVSREPSTGLPYLTVDTGAGERKVTLFKASRNRWILDYIRPSPKNRTVVYAVPQTESEEQYLDRFRFPTTNGKKRAPRIGDTGVFTYTTPKGVMSHPYRFHIGRDSMFGMPCLLEADSPTDEDCEPIDLLTIVLDGWSVTLDSIPRKRIGKDISKDAHA